MCMEAASFLGSAFSCQEVLCPLCADIFVLYIITAGNDNCSFHAYYELNMCGLYNILEFY